MRAALWLISLFSLAVATAWLAWQNQGTVAIFLTPYRVDLSLNLVLLVIPCFKAAEKIKALVTTEQITNLLKG
jgi:uncharacterized protein HemY